MRVMIVVTHLLGTGHLARALTLGQAVFDAGHHIRVVSGGMPAPHLNPGNVDVCQLPPLRSDGVNFAKLLTVGDLPVTDQFHSNRVRTLIAAFEGFSPDVLVTELFPFGRRALKDEFLTLLETAHCLPNRPFVCASIRDILAPPSKPTKATFAKETIAQFYDAVLVHSDADITPLDLSWPVTPVISDKMIYTGFVAPAAPAQPTTDAGKDEIIVSVGGGNVGEDLLLCALAAARDDGANKWRLLVGGGDTAARAKTLTAQASENVIVEAARRDFREILHHAAASVSLCGYNTALDILQTHCPAVFVPFDAGGEVEQSIRASALARQSGIEMVFTAELTPTTLLSAIRAAQAKPRFLADPKAMNGAQKTVEILSDLRIEKRQ